MKICYDYEIFWKQKFSGVASRYFYNLITHMSLNQDTEIKVFANFFLKCYWKSRGVHFDKKSIAKAKFFSGQKAKRKRSERSSIFCEAKRSEFASLSQFSQ